MLAFLITMAFKLPPESGGRMGFSLTVLLAYAVYLTIVSANLPTTSLTISVLSIYLLLTLTAGTLSIGASIMVLRCHCKKEDEPVPSWIQKKYNGFLGKFAGVTKSASYAKVHNIACVEVAELDTKKKIKTDVGNKQEIMSNTATSVNTEKTIPDWPKVTVFLDEFFFRAFFLFTVIEQVLFLVVFLFGYINH
ncbi:neuronal acetylcholine receptor subunit alpha-3-like [Ostrea edulis]|uniref:neuronal acetylcholine receptor subunit alpha-3-like n=1 Tax=Ostrea edulis TaxID=37623 RepID=UPI0024AF7379|nr:neuronal acetylcholine receptor subunit alpha-3-like [Ostrea edulis]